MSDSPLSTTMSRLHGARHRVRATLRDVFVALTGFYGVCTALYVLMHFSIGEPLSLVAFLNNFMPVLLLPAPPLLLACLLFRRWRLVLALLPSTVMVVLSYGPYFMPNFTPSRAHAGANTVPLTLLTFNMHSEFETLAPMVDLIRSANTDVVAMQELSPEAARALVAALGDRYPYRALHTDEEMDYVQGQGVLSRYPILEDEYWIAGHGQQRVVLDVDGVHVTLYNAHPAHPFVTREDGTQFVPERRSRGTDDILRRAAEETGPVILAGDFNMTDQTDIYERVAARYHDTFREAGWGFGLTFPETGLTGLDSIIVPLARIDYVFHDDGVLSLAARVWPTSGGSDHHPVFVELAVQRR